LELLVIVLISELSPRLDVPPKYVRPPSALLAPRTRLPVTCRKLVCPPVSVPRAMGALRFSVPAVIVNALRFAIELDEPSVSVPAVQLNWLVPELTLLRTR